MMNGRYLFKAKRVDNGEWVQGYYFQIQESGYILLCIGNKILTDEIDISTLCQCTGLKDKNGKLIWENDILSGHIDDSFPENETRKHVLWNENGWHTKEIESIDYEKLDNFDSENFEVIGNRFDNPKLLESEE